MNIELIPGAQISSTGLAAERLRMEVAANNIANANSTRDANGVLFQRLQVVFAAALENALSDDRPGGGLAGVRIVDVIRDDRPPIEIHSPGHPHADANGNVQTANISPLQEMVDMITATRAYEANLAAMKQSREMAEKTIELGRPS